MYWECAIKKYRQGKVRRSSPERTRPRRRALGPLAWLILVALPGCCLAAEHWTDNCEHRPPAGLAATESRATLVLIIDDLGHRRQQGMAMVKLPGKVNLAVLPHTPHASALAEAGFAAGKEIMLHTPMSNAGGTPLGAGGLTPGLSREEFDRTLADNIDAIPHVRGINNHMGSDLTTRPLQMGWVMQTLVRRELYFVDSRTNPATVAARTAADFQVPHLSRSVFLDNKIELTAISEQFAKLVALAERDGLAVGIGHPYPATADFLQEALPALRCRGIELALVSEVLAGQISQGKAGTEPIDDYDPASEPDFNAPFGHVGLGLRHSVLTKMENAGGEYRVGAAINDTGDQVIQVSDTP